MIKELIDVILVQSSYTEVYVITVVYFLVLYFLVGYLFLLICKLFEKNGLLELIIKTEIPGKNLLYEIKHSVLSIFIFGFSGIAMVYLIRKGSVQILPETFLNTSIGLLILTLWNEVHFFIIHRLMHLPFFYKTVHKIHHQSKIPTVYSVYSFHWLEAVLLSTVPISIAPFINFSASAILVYPLVSILLNYAGHCNYRFGTGSGHTWKLFGTRHANHHYKNKGSYGFVTNILDKFWT
jgi:Delta7-sterol 5-desaturase